MRKLLLMLFAATLFLSCSDDDNNYSASDLVGTWRVTNEQGYEKVNGVIQDQWDENYSENNGHRITFNENGLLSGWDEEGDRWALSGDKIVITYAYDGATEEWKIVTLTSTTLITEFAENIGNDSEYNKVTFVKVQ